MTIVTNKVLEDPIAGHFMHAKPGDPCFLCGDPLVAPYIFWMGPPEGIGLHVACSEVFAYKLLEELKRGDG